jgi:Na+/H+ antiporter NhaD/arsenite permease-like protein
MAQLTRAMGRLALLFALLFLPAVPALAQSLTLNNLVVDNQAGSFMARFGVLVDGVPEVAYNLDNGVVLGLTILGFMLHGLFHYEPATVALMGAATLLLLSDEEPHHILAEVEWPTIFFFIGLFIIIGGTVKSGLIEWLSQQVILLTGPTKESMFTLSMVMVWFSGIASAIVDNIPFVATMNPLLVELCQKVFGGTDPATLQNPVMLPVWWALALGACLGGNGTAIGASANVIVVGMSEKAGHRISFVRFLKYGTPVMFLTVFLSTIYLWLRYYVLRF